MQTSIIAGIKSKEDTLSTKDGGTSVATVKSLGVSKSGKNWKIETDKGVMNFPKKNFPQMPAISIGKGYFFIWNYFDIPNSTNVMRIVDDWREIGPNDTDTDSREQSPHRAESAQKTTQQTQKETHREPFGKDTTLPLPGASIGMIINNSVSIVVSRMGLPGTKTDPESIKKDISYWNEHFEEMARTGKLYEPF